MQELGRYWDASGWVAAGPQRHALMGLPPSVVPTNAVVPVWMGVIDSALAVSLVAPRKVLAFLNRPDFGKEPIGDVRS